MSFQQRSVDSVRTDPSRRTNIPSFAQQSAPLFKPLVTSVTVLPLWARSLLRASRNRFLLMATVLIHSTHDFPTGVYRSTQQLERRFAVGGSPSCGHSPMWPTFELHEKHENDMRKPPQYPPRNAHSHERRKSARHLITGRVWFQWQTADGSWYGGVGTTRDIGKAGVFVESESIPPVPSALKLIVVLPTGWDSDTSLCLSGFGDVRHVQQKPSQTNGFGASAVFHTEVPMSTKYTKGGEKQ